MVARNGLGLRSSTTQHSWSWKQYLGWRSTADPLNSKKNGRQSSVTGDVGGEHAAAAGGVFWVEGRDTSR